MPTQDFRKRLYGDLAFMEEDVEVPIDLGALTVTTSGSGVDAPVYTREAANSYTWVFTGDGDEQFAYFGFNLLPYIQTNSSSSGRGLKLTKVKVFYEIETAAADDVTVALATALTAADAQTITAITTTYDAAHDTAGERNTAATHAMTVTVTTPTVVNAANTTIKGEIVADINSGTVLTLRGIVAVYNTVTP